MRHEPTVPPGEWPLIVTPDDGVSAALGLLGAIHKVRSSVVDGRLAIVEHTLAPGRLAAPLHRHSREDELSVILAGRMGARLGSQALIADVGTYVLKPRGQWHTFWSAGPGELRFIEIIVPGGFEGYVERLSWMLGGPVPPDRTVLARTAAEYGIEFDFDAVPALCRRHGVTLDGWPSSDPAASHDT